MQRAGRSAPVRRGRDSRPDTSRRPSRGRSARSRKARPMRHPTRELKRTPAAPAFNRERARRRSCPARPPWTTSGSPLPSPTRGNSIARSFSARGPAGSYSRTPALAGIIGALRPWTALMTSALRSLVDRSTSRRDRRARAGAGSRSVAHLRAPSRPRGRDGADAVRTSAALRPGRDQARRFWPATRQSGWLRPNGR